MTVPNLAKTINGRTIAAGRMLLGLKQGELAKLAGVSAAGVSQVEARPEAPAGQPATLRKLIDALEREGVEILGNEELRGPNAFRGALGPDPEDVPGIQVSKDRGDPSPVKSEVFDAGDVTFPDAVPVKTEGVGVLVDDLDLDYVPKAVEPPKADPFKGAPIDDGFDLEAPTDDGDLF